MAHKLSIQKMVYCIPGQLSHIMFDCLTFRLRTSISPIKGNFNLVPSCEQRLHFRSVSWHVKSSPCRQLFKFSIVHAQNSSRDWQAKLIIRSVIKWHEFCGKKKIATTLICYARLMQCSKLVKNRKKPVF